MNATNRRQEVTWRHEYWESDKKIWEKEHTETIESRGRKYIGCEGTAVYDNRYYIIEVIRADAGEDSAVRMAVADSSESRDEYLTIALLSEAPPNASCRALCPDFATTARCTTASVDGKNQQGLAVLYTAITKIGSDNGLLKADEVQSWFGLQDDPCKRGPTALLKGKFLNIGSPCLIDVPVSATLKAQISVPMTLAGEVMFGDQQLDAHFHENLESRPALQFLRPDGSAAPLNADFGGEIVTVEAAPRSLFLKVSTNRCIGVKF